MIPKVINYIWLGKGRKSALSHICINSWYDNLVGYEIIEWNEDNLGLDDLVRSNKFLYECKRRKLWAYMADYLRLKILYDNGGIYFDTDIQVLKPFGDLLNQETLLGYEAYGVYLGTGVMGATPHHPFIKAILDFYDDEIWNVDVYTIPQVIDVVIKRNPDLFNSLKIYPPEFFGPYDYRKEYTRDCITDNTYTIHWYDGTWTSNKQVGLFLQTKHIKNPAIRSLVKVKKMVGYYKRRLRRK